MVGFPLHHRDIPLEDASTYELFERLRRGGWECQDVPKGCKAASLPSYKPLADAADADLVFYVRMKDVQFQHDYLYCLCLPTSHWEEAEVQEILHLRTRKYYACLSKGDAEGALLALEDTHTHDRKRTMPLKDKEATGDLTDLTALPLENGKAETSGSSSSSSSSSSDGSSNSEEKKQEASDDKSSGGASTGSISDDDGSDKSESSQRNRQKIVRPRGMRLSREQNGRWVDGEGVSFRWGYTPKEPSPKGTYQITCPLHKEGPLECTRTRTWYSAADREVLIYNLMNWCAAAAMVEPAPNGSLRKGHMGLPDAKAPDADSICRRCKERGFDLEGGTTDFCPLAVDWDDVESDVDGDGDLDMETRPKQMHFHLSPLESPQSQV